MTSSLLKVALGLGLVTLTACQQPIAATRTPAPAPVAAKATATKVPATAVKPIATLPVTLADTSYRTLFRSLRAALTKRYVVTKDHHILTLKVGDSSFDQKLTVTADVEDWRPFIGTRVLGEFDPATRELRILRETPYDESEQM